MVTGPAVPHPPRSYVHELSDATLLQHLADAVERARIGAEPPDDLGLAATYTLAVEIELRARTGLPALDSAVRGEALLVHAIRVLEHGVPVEWAVRWLRSTETEQRSTRHSRPESG